MASKKPGKRAREANRNGQNSSGGQGKGSGQGVTKSKGKSRRNGKGQSGESLLQCFERHSRFVESLSKPDAVPQTSDREFRTYENDRNRLAKLAKSPEGLEYWLAEERRKEEEAKKKNSQKMKKEAEQQAKNSRTQDEREYAQLVHQWHSTESERGVSAFQKCLNLDQQAVDSASLPTHSLETPVCFSLWSANMCQNWGHVDIPNGILCLESDHLATFQAGGQMCRGTIIWNKRPLKIMTLPFPYPDVAYPPKSQKLFSLACANGAALGGIRYEHCTSYICIYDRERLRLTLHRELINPSGFTSRWKNPHHFTTEWVDIWGVRIEAGQVQSALSATPSLSRGQPFEPLENENNLPSGSTGLRDVKMEHFEEDQVHVGEEDQVLVKDEDQTLVAEENNVSFHDVDHVPVGRGDQVLVNGEDHISSHEENHVLIDEEREQGEEEQEEGYEEDSHEEAYQEGYEEDYEEEDYEEEDYEEDDCEEDEDDPHAEETDSEYGNEPYDLNDMESCLKLSPIRSWRGIILPTDDDRSREDTPPPLRFTQPSPEEQEAILNGRPVELWYVGGALDEAKEYRHSDLSFRADWLQKELDRRWSIYNAEVQTFETDIALRYKLHEEMKARVVQEDQAITAAREGLSSASFPSFDLPTIYTGDKYQGSRWRLYSPEFLRTYSDPFMECDSNNYFIISREDDRPDRASSCHASIHLTCREVRIDLCPERWPRTAKGFNKPFFATVSEVVFDDYANEDCHLILNPRSRVAVALVTSELIKVSVQSSIINPPEHRDKWEPRENFDGQVPTVFEFYGVLDRGSDRVHAFLEVEG
ncbi:aflatoxin B1 aldehyde reductase member 2 [Colletotrichum scovillei]|uniref:Aflatoxin B1 aldehyde reductase member 2 n=1 Tax=Colletotrichum scovillei TaxID=1209932 RepID=A0A9P7QW48_9PEZI|nr:aflatoxin B1 aldehyde reductase member 2 [Colletotrichum scovillei]KAG7048997.1 aflatoxin B1 aldehyde reductase member 2 [Colletotrichum scovillei]KAG7063740.1 aflatoxin B1 aldehyde reductase member 2 [Colletotrichum scovillei]